MTVVGARPQFIKAAALSRVVAERDETIREILVHTGQHYDFEMSASFFDELDIPEPAVNLGVGSGSHASQTGAMMTGLEATLIEETPDVVVVYGDTNSTLAGALAAAKLSIPVAHVEAGLRSFDRTMPEEINRVVVDHLASTRFAPSDVAVKNLAAEGVSEGVLLVGDLMLDVLVHALDAARAMDDFLRSLELSPGRYVVATVHRQANAEDPRRLRRIFEGLTQVSRHGDMKVVMPLHPRTRAAVERFDIDAADLTILDPVRYVEMVALEAHAAVVATDSGGMQKEAYWLSVPCVTLRDETEWVETVETGWNRLAGTDPSRIASMISERATPAAHPRLYGDGLSAGAIVDALLRDYG